MLDNDQLEQVWSYYDHADDLQHRRHQLFVTLQVAFIAGFVTSVSARPALALILAFAGIAYAGFWAVLAWTVQRGMDFLNQELERRDSNYRQYLQLVRPIRGLFSGRRILNLYLPVVAGAVWIVLLVTTVARGGILMLRSPIFWTGVAALAASLSALFAAIYTWLTFRLVRGLSEPNVVIYVRHDESRRSILQIVIENIGRGLATDLRFTASRPIPHGAWGLSEENVQPAHTMTEGPLIGGVPTLGPGDRRTISWGQYYGLKKALGDQPISVTCEYKHGDRQMPPVTAILEIGSFAGTDALESERARLIKEVSRIGDKLSQIASSKQGESAV